MALTRSPGLLPPNFSAVYSLMFCAGVFFPGSKGWRLPIFILFATDMGLNAYYQFGRGINVLTPGLLLYLAGNYLGYGLLFGLGRCFQARSSFLSLLAAGILGAIGFYFITNTAAWLLNPFSNPEYTRDITGWLRALTFGTNGHPPTWEFFRNTLLSSGLFTALFAGTAQWHSAESPTEKGEETEPSSTPESGEAPT
ncbi:MAG: hypothetical protein EXS36_05485 [Pedosphaera sp.]|nr:hypothetical protein [Pedosphaera sp.]